MSATPITTEWPSSSTGFFSRLLPDLAAWSPPDASPGAVEATLARLAETMVRENGPDPENDRIPAGYTYFGQFIDHDVTFLAARTRIGTSRGALPNLRTPALDLDSVYSRGPEDVPYLFDAERPFSLLLGRGRKVNHSHVGVISLEEVEATDEEDLLRNHQGMALIGDPRNDENLLISQLHLAFLRFHNAALAWVETEENLSGMEGFLRARQLVRWHYQWVVLNDFLPRLAGEETVDSVLRSGRRSSASDLWRFPSGLIPLEFSGAAFRVGHSMVRSAYHLNDKLRQSLVGAPLPIFRAPSPLLSPLEDLRGRRPLPEFWTLQWNLFLSIDGTTPQPSRKIEATINPNLARLQVDGGPASSLAFRNLLRGWQLGLPSGQAVARALGASKVYDREELGLSELASDLGDEAPLWYYVLREADLEHGGVCLGPIGAEIVVRTLVKLIADDSESFLRVAPFWKPVFPSTGDSFGLADVIRFSGLSEPRFFPENAQ